MSSKQVKTAIIIGAGPAGLTAAYELATRTDIKPIVLESSPFVGGLARTISYKGNLMDIGGHRFFSKSDRVLKWWLKTLPLQKLPENSSKSIALAYHGKQKLINALGSEAPDPDKEDKVMLIRHRRSSIYYDGKFYDYPITINLNTIVSLGFIKSVKSLFSYVKSKCFPIKNEKNLRDFIINRFGEELYRSFFKAYTEKVWGVPCEKISAKWGRQRIKSLSLSKAAGHYFKKLFFGHVHAREKVVTSLAENFLYPKYGPGQMWQEVAAHITRSGGKIYLNRTVEGVSLKENKCCRVSFRNGTCADFKTLAADYVISTTAIPHLVDCLGTGVPEEVRYVSSGLKFRDFIIVGILAKDGQKGRYADQRRNNNWIYIHDTHIKAGRIQIFNNWSKYLVQNPKNLWIGVEYFCSDEDILWSMNDNELMNLASEELDRMGFVKKSNVIDGTVKRIKKAYPAYFGSYSEFFKVRKYLDRIENLYVIGRNGMHRYNNQDHSMLSAMTAVDNIINQEKSKANIWRVNADDEYQEGEK